MELVLVLVAPLVAAALVAWRVSRRDRGRWDPAAHGGDGGGAYRQAQAVAGHARDTWTSNVP